LQFIISKYLNMKFFDKIVSVLALVVIYQLASAQQPPFAPLGAKWVYNIYPCNSSTPIDQYVISVSEDSVIQGHYCTLVPSEYCPIDAGCTSNAYFVYQDGSKVYIYMPAEDDFQLLYDFSLPAGSSYKLAVCESEWAVDTLTINIVSNDPQENGYQVINATSPPPVSWGINFTIIKGVGGRFTNRLLLPDACVSQRSPASKHTCPVIMCLDMMTFLMLVCKMAQMRLI
jgi:hypothetical protein